MPILGYKPQPPSDVWGVDLATGDSMYVAWNEPTSDGGEPITKYILEWDADSAFMQASSTYGSKILELVPEVQVIEVSFQSDQGRGGHWSMELGGKVSSWLRWDASSIDVQLEVEHITGAYRRAVDAVEVVRN